MKKHRSAQQATTSRKPHFLRIGNNRRVCIFCLLFLHFHICFTFSKMKGMDCEQVNLKIDVEMIEWTSFPVWFVFSFFQFEKNSMQSLCGDIWWCFPPNSKWKHKTTHGYQRARLLFTFLSVDVAFSKCINTHIHSDSMAIFHIHTRSRAVISTCTVVHGVFIRTHSPHTNTQRNTERNEHT